MNTAKFLICVGIVLFVQGHAAAQEPDAGKIEFLSSCGACHGSDAKGKGPIADQLKVTPADLTQLAKKMAVSFLRMLSTKILTAGKKTKRTAEETCQSGAFGICIRRNYGPILRSIRSARTSIPPRIQKLRSENVSFPSSIICTENRKNNERPIFCGALVAIGT